MLASFMKINKACPTKESLFVMPIFLSKSNHIFLLDSHVFCDQQIMLIFFANSNCFSVEAEPKRWYFFCSDNSEFNEKMAQNNFSVQGDRRGGSHADQTQFTQQCPFERKKQKQVKTTGQRSFFDWNENQNAINRALIENSQSFVCGNVMGKFTKVYVRNKKQSNISLPLRFSLLRSIFVQNMSVKDAATKWRVHYSSAKIIARTAKRNKLYFMFEMEHHVAAPAKECSYKTIDPEQKAEVKLEGVKINEEEREIEHSNGQSLTHVSQGQPGKIEIHSTIGWSYANLKGLRV